jgi:hypothetical protein
VKAIGLALLSLSLLAAANAEEAPVAAPAASEHAGRMGAAAPSCADPLPKCATTAEPAFARDGTLWLAFSVGDGIYVAASKDDGKNFAPATLAANATGGIVDANGEARPKIVALPDGALLVSYTARPEKSYDGAISLVRSTDGGKSFSAPQPLVEGVGQRFDVYLLSPKGRLYAAWLDKRDAAAAKKAGQDFAGSGIAFGWSDDGGKTFSGKKILMDHSCECCRVAAALDRDGLPVFAWRQVYENNYRDQYVAKLSADGAALTGGRVSEDQWATGCPHHGPSLAIDEKGAWHVVWFTNGKARKGLFYARSVDGGKSFSAPEKFGDDAHAPAHAAIVAAKGGLHRVWKEFDGTTTSIVAQSSADGGKSWSAPHALATTTQSSDHPLLVNRKGVAYVSWLSHEHGYGLTPLPRPSPVKAAGVDGAAALAKK